MCWLSGERPESVVSFGHADSQLFKECNDFETVMVMLKFPSGLIGCIENVRGVPYGYDQRFEVRYCIVTWNSNILKKWLEGENKHKIIWLDRPSQQYCFLNISFIYRWEVSGLFFADFRFFSSVWCYSFDTKTNEEEHTPVKKYIVTKLNKYQ